MEVDMDRKSMRESQVINKLVKLWLMKLMVGYIAFLSFFLSFKFYCRSEILNQVQPCSLRPTLFKDHLPH